MFLSLPNLQDIWPDQQWGPMPASSLNPLRGMLHKHPGVLVTFNKWLQLAVGQGNGNNRCYRRFPMRMCSRMAIRCIRVCDGTGRRMRGGVHIAWQKVSQSLSNTILRNLLVIPTIGDLLHSVNFFSSTHCRFQKDPQCIHDNTQDGKQDRLQVITLSSYSLTEDQIQILSLGLTFCPDQEVDAIEVIKGVNLFARKLMFKINFW